MSKPNLHYEKFANGSVKCIEDEIPFDLPDGWAWSKIGPLCEYITSGSRGWAQYYSETGCLFLRMGNLSRDSFDLRLDNLQRVNLPDNAEGTRTRVAENDLLFSITAEIGMLIWHNGLDSRDLVVRQTKQIMLLADPDTM